MHLYATLNAQKLRSNGNRSNQGLTANELPLGPADLLPCHHVSWAPTAALWVVETKIDAYVQHTNKAKPKPDSAAALTLQSPAVAHRAHRAAQPGLGGSIQLLSPARTPARSQNRCGRGASASSPCRVTRTRPP